MQSTTCFGRSGSARSSISTNHNRTPVACGEERRSSRHLNCPPWEKARECVYILYTYIYSVSAQNTFFNYVFHPTPSNIFFNHFKLCSNICFCPHLYKLLIHLWTEMGYNITYMERNRITPTTTGPQPVSVREREREVGRHWGDKDDSGAAVADPSNICTACTAWATWAVRIASLCCLSCSSEAAA